MKNHSLFICDVVAAWHRHVPTR